MLASRGSFVLKLSAVETIAALRPTHCTASASTSTLSGGVRTRVENDSETFGHSRLLILRAVDELVNELINSVNKPMALMYIQVQNITEF